MHLSLNLALKALRLASGLLDRFTGAAAAYSLRKLSSSTSNVVRVRRSLDDTEQDFTAAEVSGGGLVNFANNGTSALYGERMYFDGVDDYVSVPSAASVDNVFAGGGTVSANVLLESLGGSSAGRILHKGSSGTIDGWHLGVDTNGLFFIQFWQSGAFKVWNATTTLINLGEVYSISVTYDNSNAANEPSFTINGISQGVVLSSSGGTPDTPDDDSGNALNIGRRADAVRQFNGIISDVNINSTASYQGYGNTNADWLDQTENNNNGTVTGFPALYSGQGFDGFVATWYDQSGNGNDAVQATTTAQPKIVASGALVAGGLDFDGVDDYLLGAHNVTSDYSFFTVTNDTGSSTSYIADTGVTAGNGVNYGRTVDSSGNRQLTLNHGGFSSVNASGFLVGESLISQTYDSTTINASVNGAAVGTSIQGYTASGTILTMGASGSLGAPFNGTMKELILYPSDQSATRTAIEGNINAHYNIYP